MPSPALRVLWTPSYPRPLLLKPVLRHRSVRRLLQSLRQYSLSVRRISASGRVANAEADTSCAVRTGPNTVAIYPCEMMADEICVRQAV
jgi:hypothetical protein